MHYGLSIIHNLELYYVIRTSFVVYGHLYDVDVPG